MIDAAVFIAEIELLQARFGHARTMPDEALARYRAYLSERMTTEEFVAAARIVFDEYEYWPSPRSFAEAVTGDVEEESAAAWDQLLALASQGDADGVTEPMLLALRSVGITFREVETAGEYRLAQIAKSFRSAYERAALPAGRQLPPPPDTLRWGDP